MNVNTNRMRAIFVLTASSLALTIYGLVGISTAAAQMPLEERFEADRIVLEKLAKAAILKLTQNVQLSDEELQEIRPLQREAFQMYKSGKTGELRRQCYKIIALALHREWTPRDEYWRSLLLRTDAVLHDSKRPLIVRLEQIYPTTYELNGPVSMRIFLVKPGSSRDDPPVKDLGVYECPITDFIDQPFKFAARLRGIDDGNYQVVAGVFEGEEPLRRLATPVTLIKNLDSLQDDLESRMSKVKGHESSKATVRYVFELGLLASLGNLDPAAFDFAAEIQKAKELVASLEKGSDPLYGAVGTHKRHYWFEDAKEIMPYRLDVPKRYDGSRTFPLIIALHGAGGNENTFMEKCNDDIKKKIDELGFIVASPMGYRMSGGFGAEVRYAGDPVKLRETKLSAKDVMNVLKLVRAEYRIDDNRIYLLGGSMGGGGAWRLASKYPGIWAAVAPICAGATPDEVNLEGMKHIPMWVSHGDADPTVPVEKSRTMVALMKELGMTYEYFEIPGGGHRIVDEAVPGALEFLARHTRKTHQE